MRKIKIFAMDVDGTLTDGKIYIGNNGEVMKAFSVLDGYGISNILINHGVVPVVITARESTIVMNRCRELGIKEIHQKCADKKEKLDHIATKYGIVSDSSGKYAEIAYIGDDLPDLKPMSVSGVVGCPGNASDAVKRKADYICKRNAGDGAVREFIEYLEICSFI